MDNDNIRPVLLPAQPTIHNMLYGTATQLQRTAGISAAMNRRERSVRCVGTKKGTNVRPVCRIIGYLRCQLAGVGSSTFTLTQMTVAMLLWSSLMTWIYSCCWSTGHGAVIYRVMSPSRWRSETVLSYKSMPLAQNVGEPLCSQLLLSPRIQSTHCDTVSYTVGKGKTSTLKTLKEWAFRGYSTGWGGVCVSGSREQFIVVL